VTPTSTAPNSDGKGRRVRLDDLGAWLVKGNADRADLAGRFALDPRVTAWCVQPSYRLGLMRAGQPVLFWASGSRHALPYGIWGLGRLSGPPRLSSDGGWSVPLEVSIADRGDRLAREVLKADPRLRDLEVLRQPQAANPSFVTRAQFAAINDLWQIADRLGVEPAQDSGCPPVTPSTSPVT
jgi:hypothetical protein